MLCEHIGKINVCNEYNCIIITMLTLSYSPGQTVTIFLETKNSDGYYADGYYGNGYSIDGYESPVIQRIIKPDMTLNSAYPHPMTKFDTGIYYISFTLPTGASAVGSYYVSAAYRNPDNDLLQFESYLILVRAPFGLYSATSF